MVPLYIHFTELISTLLLAILIGNSVCTNLALKKTVGNRSRLINIASGFTFIVFLGAIISVIINKVHSIPEVKIKRAIAENLLCNEIQINIISQLIGAVLGTILVYIQYKNNLDTTKNPNFKKDVFSTNPTIKNYLKNPISEIIGIYVLTFTIFYILIGYFKINENSSIFGLSSLISVPIALFIRSYNRNINNQWYIPLESFSVQYKK
ncbi:aquaporin [Apibacter adventoris]|uniref:aquaporin n=1 Tax=Apibacter adventoris TaxID=1679466 RepID=UPI000CF62894|nr:aquaporin [Apibacter adventoris]PQL91947.1 hypothetical protein C4S76_11055 [Apibacter adventoris]